jgi:hypothetical protein
MMTTQAAAAHLTTGQVAAILDERLRGADREPAFAHLAACAECRREMAELHRALHDRERKRRSVRPWVILASGLAAALVLLAIPAGVHRVRSSGPVATRDGASEPVDAASPIVVVVPRDGASVGPTPSLIWRGSGPGASFLVTVQDTSGTVVWSAASTDTAFTVPISAGLSSGHRYFWSVDARLSSGVSTSAGVREFTVR